MTASSPDLDPAALEQLQRRLLPLWQSLQSEPAPPHTSVVVPSLSFDVDEMSKIQGVSLYEERLLFSLIRLRDPGTTVIYATSQPIHPEIIDYYLHLLRGVSVSNARSRLHLISLYDSSAVPLSRKLLERPRTLARMRSLIRDPERAYMTCFNTTELEHRLALALGIPVNGVSPELHWAGTKSGSRKVFREAGIELAPGFEDVRSKEDVLDALSELGARHPELSRAVVKLDESFAGAGNAIFTFPSEGRDRAALERGLQSLALTSGTDSPEGFLSKLERMGGIVEGFVEAPGVQSPSAQLRVNPDGSVAAISTHDQVLGGPTGQTYVGCRFPAADAYRGLVQECGTKVAEVLRDHGAVGRFGIDFLVFEQPAGQWRCVAVEINLRMGGTTPPFMALQFLTLGGLDAESGLYRSRTGAPKFYYATDNLRSPLYRGLVVEDFTEIVAARGLDFDPTTETGSVFHMIGALSEFGKVGVTCIADSPRDAEELYARVVSELDREGGGGQPEARPEHPFDFAATGMI